MSRNGKTEIEKFTALQTRSLSDICGRATDVFDVGEWLLELEVFNIEHWFSREKIQWLGLDFYMDF